MSKMRLRLRAVLATAWSAPAPTLILLAIVGWWLFIGWHPETHGALETGVPDGQVLLTPSAEQAHAGHNGHGSTFSAAVILPAVGMWLAMILAMSPPMLIREVDTLWRTSLRRNRTVRVLLFLFGYSLVWALAGLVAVPLNLANPGNIALIGCMAIAVLVWQFSSPRLRLLRRCHRTPALRAFGFDASRESLRYGLGSGALCVGLCGPAMVLVLLTGQFHVFTMAVAATVLTIERYLPIGRRRRSLLTRRWGSAPRYRSFHPVPR